MPLRTFSTILFLILPLQMLWAQTSIPNEIHALKISEPIRLDGQLSEPAWQ